MSRRDRGEKEPHYGIVVRLNNGGRVRFACRSRDMAVRTLASLNHQLHVETRSSGRLPSNLDMPDIRDSVLPPLHSGGANP